MVFPVEPYTKGENIRLYNMDCVEGAKEYVASGSVDLLIADPPFAIDEQRLARYYTKYPDRVIPGYVFAPDDYYQFSIAWMVQAYRVLKEHGSMYVVSGWSQGHIIQTALVKLGFVMINEIIYQYSFPMVAKHKFNSAHCRIYYCKKHKYAKPTFRTYCRYAKTDKDENGKSLHYRDMSSVWSFQKESRRGKLKHLTKLPDELVRKMLAYSSRDNDLIADFFLGSGTTAIQAHTMKKRVVGFEKNSDAFQHLIAQLEGTRSDGVTKARSTMITSI
jgi:site-specific DNA-methyltransferase (adenine-specific)